VMLVSDGIGLAAAVLLAEPGVRDQIYRYQEARQRKGAEASKFEVLKTALADTWKAKRDSYTSLDALCTLVGALLLIVTFLLKLAEL